MRQVIQDYRTGTLRVEEVPAPAMKRGGLLVRTAYSLISAGTERDTLKIAQKSLVGKAQSRPDLVQKVMDTARKEGIQRTYQIVKDRLNAPVPMGYSLAGKVIEVARDVAGFSVGDRVACAGVGYANHAEVAFVPKHLCAKVPEGLPLKHAAFGTLGAIALHAARQASLSIGDSVGVIGLGLLGLLSLQICKSSGCRVLGIDLAEGPIQTAKELGADLALLRNDPDLDTKIDYFTQGRGLDRVIIAAGTESKDPFLFSAQILRDRGLLVLLGGIRMEVVRTISSLFYEKEVEIRLARSYGPGRYDAQYEERGQDYPIGYVRWTEQRNLACFLDLLAHAKVQVDPLITSIVPIEEAEKAYALIQEGTSSTMGILLSYSSSEAVRKATDILPAKPSVSGSRQPVGVGMIGAGNFARSNLLPPMQKNKNVQLHSLMTSTGMKAREAAKRFGFLRCTESVEEIVADPACSLIMIATRHDSHAHYVQIGLEQGKTVYVEKPLAISMEQLRGIWQAWKASSGALMVGYNRRFAPLVEDLKDFFRGVPTPLTIIYRVNAGSIGPEHWYQDPDQGGRIVGEGCHFADICQFLSDSDPASVFCCGVPDQEKSIQNQDNITLNIRFANGAIGVVHYLSEGDPSMPKERIEVYGGHRCAALNDFKELTLYKQRKKRTVRRSRPDKGHGAEMDRLVNFTMGLIPPPIPAESLFFTSLITLEALDSLATGQPRNISLASLDSEHDS